MCQYVISILVVLHLVLPVASQRQVEGVVFEDKNRDGIWQKGEKRLKNILVSAGDTIVATDKKGMYRIAVSEGDGVFPILPGSYSLASEGIASRHFLHIKTASDETLRHDFALIPVADPVTFRADIIGDVQAKNVEELHFAQRTILSELTENGKKSFVLFMGDLSNDNDTILQLIRDCIGQLPFTSWTVVGNHDLNQTKPRTASVFKELFGSEVAAFFKGKACFILLSNCKEGKGYIPPSQIRFVGQLMKRLSRDILPVICQHVPLYGVSNRDELLETIGERRCLILSAHAHSISRHHWNRWVNEWVVGATCGSWWVGERHHEGIPIALQQCGAPRNYFQLLMNGNEYQLRFKGVGLPLDKQMSIWIKGQDALDDSIPALSTLPEGYVAATIYAGGDSTRVEISIDGGDWIRMRHTLMVDPSVRRIIEWNKRKFYPTAYAKRIPLRASPSPHLWTYQLPAEALCGFHTLSIRASDAFGFAPVEQSRLFYFQGKNAN